MKISTKYLLKKALIWCWLAAFIGALFAGGYYALVWKNADEIDKSKNTAELEEDLENNAQVIRYALYDLEYTEHFIEQSDGIGLDRYANSTNEFFIGRLTSDSSYWRYYDRILKEYSDLEPQVFTSDKMREMISIWQYQFEIVVRVKVPEIKESEWSSYAVALGLAEDQEHFEQFTAEEKEKAMNTVQCNLRDLLFYAINDYIEHNEIVNPDVARPIRAETHYEELMDLQSIIQSQEKDNKIEAGQTISKKKLVLVFMLGAALVEGVVILLALFDGRIKDESDLIANSNLNVLQTVEAEDTWLEAALKLKLSKSWGKPLALVGVGIQEDELKASVQQLGEALKRVYGQEYPCTLAVNAVKNDLSWTLLLEDRPVVLVAEQMKTTYSNLQSAAESMQLVSNDICGIVLRKASRDKHRKG